MESGAGPDPAARAEARVGLYVHVPFCAVRCHYCDFSTGSLSSAKLERYLVAIGHETARRASQTAGVRFTSVFFGGGTPSALSARHFRRLWKLLTDHFAIAAGAEITLEANPETVKPALLEAWAAAGVNRLSMGAQSFDQGELARLGRVHGPERPAEALALARAHGFRRLSLDLMFGFPGHGERTWAATLARATELSPEHLSAYCFIPESGTPLGDAIARGAVRLPSPDAQADRYAELEDTLARAGYGCYETSNFCRPGAEARHNLVYWLRRDSLGLGPSAHGLWRGVRYGNHYALDRWAHALERGTACETIEIGSEASRADEIVMLGLRLANGLWLEDYPEADRRAVERRYGAAFSAALAARRLERTPRGVAIAARHRFVADDVIAWLMARAARVGFDTAPNRSVTSPSCHIPHSPAA